MEKSLKLYTYDTNGVEVAFPNDTEQAIATSFTYNAARMGDAPSLNFTLMHTLCLDDSWSKDVHVEFNGERYYLRQTPTSVYDNTDSRYKHTVDMVSERIVLNDVYFFDVVSDMYESDKPISNSSNVVFFGDIYEFANRLRASLNYSQIDYDVVIDDGVTSEGQLMSFNNMFFSNVLQEIYNKYKLPYYFVGKTIHIGEYENEISEVFEYGSDKALMSVSKSNANFKVVNRCTGVGSSENIPYYYPNPTPYGVVEYLYNGVATNNIVVYDWGRFARCGVNKSLVYSEIDRYGTNVQNINLADLTNYGTVKITEILDENIYGWVGVYEFTIPDGKPCSLVGAIGNSFEGGFYKLELTDEDDITLWSGTLIPSEGIALAYGNFKIYATFGVGSDDIGAETTARNYGYLSLSVKEANSKIYSWTLDERVVSLGSIGIKNLGGAPAVGDTISFRCDESSRVAASPNLMPHVYRDTEYSERFYNAQNQTYTDDDGNYYDFSNPYIAGWPKEHIVDFPDIKPTLEGVLNNSNQPINVFEAFEYDAEDNDELDENGNYKHPYFFAKLRRFDKFNLFEQSIEGGAMTVSMISGACGACKWTIGVDESSKMNTVQVNDNGELERDANGNVVINAAPQDFQNDTRNNSVWIALKKEENTFGVIMPNRAHDYFPEAGDTFTILDISMPQEYIISAEQRLEKAIIKYMAENNDEKFNFAIKLSRIHLEENHEILNTLNENSVVKVKYNNKEYRLHVSSYSYKMNDNEALPEVTIELSDTLTVNRGTLQNTINTIKGDIVVSRQQSHDEIEQAVQKKADKSTTLAGYGITDAFTMSEARDEFMSTRSTEDITSIKNFAGGIKIGGMLVRYDESIDAFIFPTNVLVEKGMSTYTTFDNARLISVFDGLPIDGQTLIWKITSDGDKILVVNPDIIGGGGSGDVGEITSAAIISALGYTPYDGASNPLGFLKTITSSQVTSALGFTPFDEDNFTKSNIKSTLGISDWALASTKPSYNFSEIGSKPTTLSGYGITDAVKFLDGIDASTAYKEVGYGYKADGWVGAGPAMTFGAKLSDGYFYKALLQYNWNDYGLHIGYVYRGGSTVWKKLAYAGTTLSDYGITNAYTKTEADSKYLRKSGGTISNTIIAPLVVENTSGAEVAIRFLNKNNTKYGGYLVWGDSKWSVTDDGWGMSWELLNEGNYTTWAMSKSVAQEVSAVHNFANGIKLFGKSPFLYNASKDTWELDGNLVITKGLATYTRLEGFEELDITMAISVDGDTISNEGGVLHVVGGTGGDIDEDTVNALIDDALVGYAKESWVESKGYALGSTQITAGTGLKGGGTLAANRTLSLATIGTAGTYTKVTTDAYGRVKSGTTLLASDIPGLAWSKITSGKPTTLSGYGITDAVKYNSDMRASDAYRELGYGYAHNDSKWHGSGPAIAFGNEDYKAFLQLDWNSDNDLWVGYDYNSGNVVWKRIAYDGESYTKSESNARYLKLTGGELSGDISLPYGNRLISPSGNIAGTRIFGNDTVNYRTLLGTASLNTLLVGNDTLKFWKGTVGQEYEIIDTSMSSISFPKYIATGIGTFEQSGYKVKGNSIDATFGANDATGGAYIWLSSYHALRFATNSAERMRITKDGNVAIGGTTADAKLHVHGNLLVAGGIALQNSSDRRLKRNLRRFNASEVLMSLGGVYRYEYIESEVEKNDIYRGSHFGLIYQNVRNTALDVMCIEREDGYGSLNYLHPSFISLLAAVGIEHETKLSDHEKRIKELEDMIVNKNK